MGEVTSQPWFGWVIAVVIGLPVSIIVLTELRTWLIRRDSSLAGPVNLLRTYILPTAALLILLVQVPNDIVETEGSGVRIVATILGFLILLFVLSTLNAAVFLNASRGSWRDRMPSIFVDLVRLFLIVAGLAVLFSWVWGANIGGLFAAFGVTSIVLGLALQNAVGSIISGLLLLFEQPFQIGDWLSAAGVQGRVIEVNWRAVHIQTANGVQVVPNAMLASSSFTNLSRPTTAYSEIIEVEFSDDDPPLAVIAMLDRVGAGIAMVAPGARPSTVPTGPRTFATSLPLASITDAAAVRAQFLTRVWYAARRENLGLHGADIWKGERTEDVAAVLNRFAGALRIPPDDIEGLAQRMDIERYAEGEVVQPAGQVPVAVRYLHEGRATLNVSQNGVYVPALSLEAGDYIGQTALTRMPSSFTAIANAELTVLVVPRDVLDDLVRNNPDLAREIGRTIEQRRQIAAEARAAMDVRVPLPR